MTDFYADSNVAGPGSGTIGDPWDDATTHLPSLVAGDTLFLRAGSYAEAQIEFGANGTAANPIILKAYNNEAAIITGVPGDHGVDTSGFDWCVIEDLEFDKSGDAAFGIKLDGDNSIVRNCDIHDCKEGGVSISGDDNTVEDCTIHDVHNTNVTDALGVMVDSGFDNIIQNNTMYNCHGDCVQMRNTGAKGGTQILNNDFFCSDAAEALCCEGAIDIKRGSATDQCIIRGNTMHLFRRPDNSCGGSGGLGPAIALHQDCENVLVEDNIFYDCSHAIRIDSAPDVIVQNNLLYEFVIDWNGDSKCMNIANGTSDPIIYNNTFVDMPDEMWDLDDASTPVIKNNLHQNTGANSGGAGATYDYNGWYDSADMVVGANDTVGTAPQPNFTDAGSDNYTLTADSSAIDAGEDVGLAFLGNAPDLGYIEFSGGASAPPGPAPTVALCLVVADYQVRLKDQSGAVVAIFDDWRSLQFKRQINSPGFFTFIINGNDDRAVLFEADTQVEIWRSLPGVLDWYIEAEAVVENTEYTLFSNGNLQFTAVGSMYLGLLKRRIIGYMETEAGALKTDPAETVMKEYVDENIGPSATVALGRLAEGAMAGMAVAASGGSGDSWTGDRAGKNLLSILAEIANFAAIDFDVIGTGAAIYEFQTFVDQLGEDRTTTGLDSSTGLNSAGNAPVIFDPLFGNVENMRYALRRRNEINTVFIFGQGFTVTRNIAIRSNAAQVNATPINLREGMRGGGSQSTAADLNNLGDDQLELLQRKEVFDFAPLDTDGTLYGVHYTFGDSVTARLGTIERNKRITGVTFSVAGDGEQKTIEFTDIP